MHLHWNFPLLFLAENALGLDIQGSPYTCGSQGTEVPSKAVDTVT